MFRDYTTPVLKKIIRLYNLHFTIKGYSKMTKDELIKAIENNLVFKDGRIHTKEMDKYKFNVPLTSKEQKRVDNLRKESIELQKQISDLYRKKTKYMDEAWERVKFENKFERTEKTKIKKLKTEDEKKKALNELENLLIKRHNDRETEDKNDKLLFAQLIKKRNKISDELWIIDHPK